MELDFHNIEMNKPSISINTHIKSRNNKKLGNNNFIEIIDYGMSLLNQENIDLKMELFLSLFQKSKNFAQLIEEFGNTPNLLKGLYELTSFGFIIQKNLANKIQNKYEECEYVFNQDKFIFKIRQNLGIKKRILEDAKALFEKEILFQCQKCNITYDYVQAITNKFKCCEQDLAELGKDNILNEINKKLVIIEDTLKKSDEI